MTPDSIFQVCSTIAMAGWIVLLIASPFWMSFDKFVIGIIITLFAIVYAWLIAQSFTTGDFEKFGSLNGVMELFTNRTAVTAGWVHYLAFDLLTGTWIKKNSIKYNISHWLLIPCLFLTFMLGPVGLLLYLLIRTIMAKRYFAENY
jgi:hypothetical protein